MAPNPIDEVVQRLTEIIQKAEGEGSRTGYFAGLYRRVTLSVRDHLQEFEDPERMARLDFNFAGRYLEALDREEAGQEPPSAWKVAFEAAQDPEPIIVQHLILGINAHINLDLGIAAARTSPGAELPSLRNDFLKINGLLASLIPTVMTELAEVSPLTGLIERVLGQADDRIANFSLKAARDWAWHVAQLLAPLPPQDQEPAIESIDRLVAAFGRHLWHPDPVLAALYKVIRSKETETVPQVIAVLARE